VLATPTRVTLVAGAAEGRTALNAFDGALLAAGVGNLNLIKVSSILPPGCRVVAGADIAPGTLTPTAYGSVTSHTPGEIIAAAIAVGQSRQGFGVIMEYAGSGRAGDAERVVREMVAEACETRGLELEAVHARAVEHRVVRLGCAFAGAVLWYGE